MVARMQIPGNPFALVPGILQQPQAGGRQQVDAGSQAKANGQGADATRGAATPDAGKGAAPKRLMAARSLEETVSLLGRDGKLPPRGSLVDLRV